MFLAMLHNINGNIVLTFIVLLNLPFLLKDIFSKPRKSDDKVFKGNKYIRLKMYKTNYIKLIIIKK